MLPRSIQSLCLLAFVGALLYLPATSVIPLMDRDEPRFAHATVEMMQRDEWVIPYFNGEYRFDKPPLTYWWMRLHFALFGVSEFAARLHSVVSAVLVAWTLWGMGKRMRSEGAGFIAAIAWLTSMQTLVHGRLSVADMPMVLCVALSQWALMELLRPPDRRERERFNRWFWILWISLGLGFLAKGPIALLVPGLALLLWRWVLGRKPLPWCRLQWRIGPWITLVIIASWGVPALVMTHGQFWSVGMGEHVVKRGTDAFNGRMVFPFYYVGAALFSLMPWIALLPFVVKHMRQTWSSQWSFLLSWLLAPQIIFFLYATQLPHYVMPGFPAFFLMIGLCLADSRTHEQTLFRWPGRFYLALCIAVAVLLMSGLWLQLPNVRPELKPLGVGVGLILLALNLAGIALIQNWRWASLIAGVGLAVSLQHAAEVVRELHPVVKMQESIRGSGEALAWRYTEPCLVFYGDRPWKFVSKLDKVASHMREGKADTVVCHKREWTLNHWLQSLRGEKPGGPDFDSSDDLKILDRAPDYQAADVAGLNLARSSWVEIRVWKKVTH